MPDEAHRLRIWDCMFPSAASREETLGIGPLARKFELSGGEIRNVALAAAYVAAKDGQLLARRQFKQAPIHKQTKSGRVSDEKEFEGL